MEDSIEKESSFKRIPLLELTLGHQLRPATVIEVDGLFSCRKPPTQKPCQDDLKILYLVSLKIFFVMDKKNPMVDHPKKITDRLKGV